MRRPLIRIRSGQDWFGRPVWTWRCTACPRKPGRKPVGGDHRVSTFTSRSRRDYPPAFERCRTAALAHLAAKHNLATADLKIRRAWNQRVQALVNEALKVS